MAGHQELADFIKKVHIDLRISSREIGAEKAWEEHSKKSALLKDYATAMQHLAVTYWGKNNADDPNLNRIYWVVKECNHFYRLHGWKTALDTECKMYRKYYDADPIYDIARLDEPIEMLDVGSCYNPFKQFDEFKVTAIDIAPASEDVIKCDFLLESLDDVPYLRRLSYNVVLFSFLLEYLPHPKMRFDCCKKAYDLLNTGGILIILTPDSKHGTANSQVIKKWRLGLASIGFIRINYSKLRHLHCMTFYKCVNSRVAQTWLQKQRIQITPEECIVIPQDNNPYDIPASKEPIEDRCDTDNNLLAQTFADLADGDVYAD